ncbi:M16 family metallopeptidase [Altererythrobacter sp. MF3-039]|uniref:M16 family metallopeptidase n=1 Tax=Altererythrobacter sp. MF3-039 TaxID=3252901 RepID=UPI00390CC978
MKTATLAVLLSLAPCALAAQEVAPNSSQTNVEAPEWAFEGSDIIPDPAFRFGRLANGMRYVIASNGRPEGTAIVRMWVGSGSLSERENERGLAHFLEHMAFNGTTNVPEGEMIRILEREGLRFGADTNASTGFEDTTYKLDLPRNDPELLDTALMLMRETASEILIEPDAVERERGIILSERRDRQTYSWRNFLDEIEFRNPDARYLDRMPIGTLEVLASAGAQEIRNYYEREYVPANTVVVVVGDFQADSVERAIEKHFSSWQSAPMADELDAGPIDTARQGLTDIFLDPALSERVTLSRHRAWDRQPDSTATRRQNVLTGIGYDIINRRLRALARGEDAPFRGAGYGTGDVFEVAQTTNLVIDTADGEWRDGLLAAVRVVRQAIQYGFSEAEVAEQVARLRTAQENSVAAASTRTNQSLTASALLLIEDGIVPSSPQASLARFASFEPYLTPAAVLAALRQDAATLVNPLIRFEGRKAPKGGEAALRNAWNEAMALPIARPEVRSSMEFAYQSFGEPGEVMSDLQNERFGMRLVTFANGVMLTLKKTDLAEDRIRYRMSLDGGRLIETKGDPLATAMVSSIPVGGLGAHSQDELDTILAGRSVQWSMSADTDAFVLGGTTTPRDLELQLQLLAAAITDPGYRKEGEQRYSQSVADFFANLDATPRRVLSNRQGAILSDGDPRFSLQSREAYEALSYARLRDAITDRLTNGAIEIALVGDLDEDRAIEMVARTLGALNPRETSFQAREAARLRSFTSQRRRHIVTHSGEADQALVHLVWPTRDDSDLEEAAELRLLGRIVQIAVQEELRERLGKTYSPNAFSSPSSEWTGFGTFSISASVDYADVEETLAATRQTLLALAEAPIDADLIDRARQPLLESFDNRLKSLASWIAVADRAQSKSDRLERFDAWPAAVEAIDGERLAAAAKRWLVDSAPVEILVVPEGSDLAD